MLASMKPFDREELEHADPPVYSRREKVRLADVDAAGVVFFAKFFDYAHDTYEDFLEHIDCGLPRVLDERRWAAPLRHAEADFRASLRYGDQFQVQLVRADLEPSEVLLGFRLVRGDGRLCATVQTIHVFISATDRQRTSVPTELVQAVTPIVRQ